MSPFLRQLHREGWWDVRVAAVLLAILFGCMLLLPKSWFWFYLIPIAAFWYRYIWVRDARDEALLRADAAAHGGVSAPGCYCSEAGICISDGTEHVLVFGQKLDAPLQLTHIVRDE